MTWPQFSTYSKTPDTMLEPICTLASRICSPRSCLMFPLEGHGKKMHKITLASITWTLTMCRGMAVNPSYLFLHVLLSKALELQAVLTSIYRQGDLHDWPRVMQQLPSDRTRYSGLETFKVPGKDLVAQILGGKSSRRWLNLGLPS